MEKKYDHVVAYGKAIITKRGVLGPGSEIECNDLANPENFELLKKKQRVIEKKSFVNNDDAQYRKEDLKTDEKTELKNSKKKEGFIKAPIK